MYTVLAKKARQYSIGAVYKRADGTRRCEECAWIPLCLQPTSTSRLRISTLRLPASIALGTFIDRSHRTPDEGRLMVASSLARIERSAGESV